MIWDSSFSIQEFQVREILEIPFKAISYRFWFSSFTKVWRSCFVLLNLYVLSKSSSIYKRRKSTVSVLLSGGGAIESLLWVVSQSTYSTHRISDRIKLLLLANFIFFTLHNISIFEIHKSFKTLFIFLRLVINRKVIYWSFYPKITVSRIKSQFIIKSIDEFLRF